MRVRSKQRRTGPAGKDRHTEPASDDVTGTDGFVAQIGLFETANGLPHGPVAIVLAIAAAVALYPIGRLIRFATRRT